MSQGKDFSHKNLQDRSFKGQNLAGANFSNADLRGANFTGANLQGANFTGAKAGLPLRWTIFLVVLSWLLSGTSGFLFLFNGFLIAYIFDSSTTIENRVSGWAALIVTIIVYIIIIRQGIGVNFAFAFAFAFAVAGAFAFAGAGAVAFAVAGAFAFAFAFAGAVAVAAAFAVAGAFAVAAAVALTFAFVGAGAVAFAFAGAVAVAAAAAVISSYIAWRAMKGNKKYALIRDAAVRFAAIGGTSFRSADLTDANFTFARLKSTDFRRAKLTRTCFHKTKLLDRVRPGTSYLQHSQLRQLFTTGVGQGKIFDRQDLRGINLKEANLAGASFIDTDLSQANLQGADLFEAKLVHTNLDQANLSNVHLTGAYIEDWGITRRTRLDGVKCKYVYLKLPTEGDRDPNRMPPPEQGEFGENDFNIFITSVLDTLDLYHKDNINAGVAITILKGLTKDYPVQFELVGLEKRGENQFVIRLKVFGQTSHFQLQREYYARYEQTLPLYDPKKLMPSTDVVVEEIIQTVKENPGTHIENLHNQGIVITGGSVNMSGDKHEVHLRSNHNIHMGGGNYNERIEGDYNQNSGITQKMSGGTMHGGMQAAQGDHNNQTMDTNVVSPSQKQTLTEAAAEIQALLEQLEKSYPTDTTMGKMALATEAITQIDNNPTLTARILSALQVGSIKAFEQFLNHPAASFVIGALEDWQKTKGN